MPASPWLRTICSHPASLQPGGLFSPQLFVQFGNCVYLIFPFCLLLGVRLAVIAIPLAEVKIFVPYGDTAWLPVPCSAPAPSARLAPGGLPPPCSEVVWCRPPTVLCDGTGPLTIWTSAPRTFASVHGSPSFCLRFEPVGRWGLR